MRMVIKKTIPTTVTIDSETTCVSHIGQLQSCRHCNELVHNGITCIQNRKLLLQKLQADKSSYVSVVKQSTAPKDNTSHKLRRTQTKPAMSQQPHKAGSSTSPAPPKSKAKANESMPPPVFTKLPVPAINTDSEFPALRSQQQPTTNDYIHRRSDDHDTDCSTTSTSSRCLRSRPPGKKMRPNDKDHSNDENQ